MKEKYINHYLLTLLFLFVMILNSCTGNNTTDEAVRDIETIDFESIATTNVNEARKIVDETLRKAEATNNDTLFLRGYYYRTLLDVNSALTDRVIKDSEDALIYSDKIDDSYFKNKIFIILGKFYVLKNEYTVALNYYLKSRDYFEKTDDKDNLAVAFNGLAILYFEMGDYDNSILNFNNAYELYKETGDTRGIGVFYGNMGNVYNVKEDFIKAKEYQQKSLATFKALNDTVNIVSIMINLSNIESNLKNFDSSSVMLNDALVLTESINNARLKERILLNMGINHYEKNQLEEAGKKFNEELDLAKKIHFPNGKLDAFMWLADVAKKQNDYKKHAEYTRSYYSLKDSIYGYEVKQKIEELKWTNEFEKSELEKNLLKNKYDVEKERSKYLTVSIILTSFLSLLIIGFVWLFYRNNKKNLQISEFENERLQERIAREEINTEKEKAENEILKLKSQQQELELDSKNREITSISLQLVAKNKLMSEISQVLDNSKKSKSNIESDLKSILFQNQNQEKDWEQFREVFERIHPGFFDRIKSEYPQLSVTDVRICAYIKIRMSLNEVASLLNISLQSLHTSRYRIRKKLNLNTDQNLDDFIFERF